MPAIYKGVAASARERHKGRVLQPGVTVEVEKTDLHGYRLVSPHRDYESWLAMICDALGTRSIDTANTFLRQLTQLCPQYWSSDGEAGQGEWVPDEDEINMVLAMVAGIKPRNEMEAALAAQMVAVHLITMRTAASVLKHESYIAPQSAAIVGKLARTFAMQTDAMANMKGKRSSRQTITVRQEKHVHHHQHVHLARGAEETGGQPLTTEGAGIASECAPMPCQDESGKVVLLPCSEGQAGLPNARRPRVGRSNG
jgi:hypothetical protein